MTPRNRAATSRVRLSIASYGSTSGRWPAGNRAGAALISSTSSHQRVRGTPKVTTRTAVTFFGPRTLS